MRAWLVAAIVAAPSVAIADAVAVTVIEVAGDLAYVTPGKAAGLAAGNKVTIADVERTILEVTEDTAAIKLDGLVVAIGQRGMVDVVGGARTGQATDAPLRAEPFTGGWPEPVVPSQTQQVTPVPLGSGRRSGRLRVTMIGSAYAAASKERSFLDGDARLIASWDLVAERPLAIDLDVAGRTYTDGYDKNLRVPVFVRAAQLRYGPAIDPTFALGRLRYAATSVGMLDGARGAVHAGNFELAAFGGVVPDPVSGRPDPSASRFGAEVVYDLPKNDWRPRASLAATGSTFDGELDERRLAVTTRMNRGALWIDGWADAQSFPKDNPWGARAVELTGAGGSVQWRSRGDHLGVDVDFLRPDRSLRLAAALPPGWLCSEVPQPGDLVETCRDGDHWTTATASAGLRRGRLTLDGYGTLGRANLITTTLHRSAYVRGEIAIDEFRVALGGSAGNNGFASWNSGELGLGATQWKPFDVMVRYRLELLDYVASTGPVVLHAIAGDLRYPYATSIDLAVSAVGTTGPDRTVAALLATVVWRPLP